MKPLLLKLILLHRLKASFTFYWLLLVMCSQGASAQPVAPEGSRGPELVLQTGHADSCTVLALSPDEKYVASGGFDGWIRLWDTSSGQEIRQYPPLKNTSSTQSLQYQQAAQEVPLSPEGIIVVEPRLFDADGEDSLGLEKALKESLEAASLGQLMVNGITLTGVIYVPVEEMPTAWRVAGNYRLEGQSLILDLSLRRGDSTPVRKTLRSAKGDVAELATIAVAMIRNVAIGLNSPDIVLASGRRNLNRAAGKSAPKPSLVVPQPSALGSRTLMPQPTQHFGSTPLPREGEIALAGEIELVDESNQQWIVRVSAFRVSNGKAQSLAAGKSKVVTLPSGIEPTTGRRGDKLVVIGTDAGKGQPLTARAIFRF